jgi:sugar phosphate isomerase/epimerase
MSLPIAVQLYSVREALEVDFASTIRRLADIGYRGVEFAGIYGASPQSAAALCRDLGLTITSAHLPSLSEDPHISAERAAALGIDIVVCAWLPPERFSSLDGIRSVCDELNAAAAAFKALGLRFAYHNHDFEFFSVDGVGIPHEVMRRYLSADVLFEIDSYWVKVGGADPAAVLHELNGRVPLLHLKDGPGVNTEPMLALGGGFMDIPQVVAASHADWLIVELDRTATDMLEALQESYNYLAEQGIANGR